MKIAGWCCLVLLTIGLVHGQAQGPTSKSGDIVVPLKKPGAPLRVSGMTSAKVCPKVQWTTFDAQRTMAPDGSIIGLAGDEGSWRVQRCTHQGVSWSFPLKTKPQITVDGAGEVLLVNPVKGANNLARLRKLTAEGKLRWQSNLSTSGKHLYVGARPGGADGSVYVSAVTDGVLTGASPLGKGTPSVSKYDRKGKRSWTTYVGKGAFGMQFDVDAKGHVYAVTSHRKEPLHFVKLSPAGKVLFDRKLTFKKGGPSAGINAVRVDRKTGDVYLILRGPGENDYGAARLRGDGQVVWAQSARLKHESGGGEEWFFGAGVVGDTFYVFQTYAFENYDNPDGFPDDQYELLALGFRVADGRAKFARTEWYSGMEVSDTNLLGDAFVLPGKIAVPMSVSTSFKVGANGKPKFPWLAPLPRPEGDYFLDHKVSYYDEGVDKVADVQDVLTIRHAGKANLRVKVNFVAGNFHECQFEGTMTAAGPNTWTYQAKGSSCVVTLTNGADQVSIQGGDTCDREWCGARASLNGSFPTKSRKPVGTYDWPEL